MPASGVEVGGEAARGVGGGEHHQGEHEEYDEKYVVAAARSRRRCGSGCLRCGVP